MPGLFRLAERAVVTDARSMRAKRLRAAGESLGSPLNDTVVAQLLAFIETLHRWNATYNLTAIRDPDEMLSQHVVDCLAATHALQARVAPGSLRILDVGSGGGLPGVVIAALRAEDQVVCVDSVGKKAAFIRQVAAELQLPNLRAEHARVEALRLPPFDVITSRAFSSLADFVRLTRPLMAEGGVWMAMKGRRPDEELTALPPDIEVFHVEHLDVPGLAAERCLVWMRLHRRTGA